MNYKTILDPIYYRFDAPNKKIHFNSGRGLSIKIGEILLITNATRNNTRIYNSVCPEEGGVLLNNVLTLVVDTSVDMLSTDDLVVLIETKNPLEDINSKIALFLETLVEDAKNTQEQNLLILEELNEIKRQSVPVMSKFKNISTAATTVVVNGTGLFERVLLNNPTNNAITIYDGIDASNGVLIATIDPDASATPFELNYNLKYKKGITVVTAGSPDITIIYQ